MRRNLVALTAAIFALVASDAMAANYGMAGCGLGAVVFKDQPGKIQILAATTNNLVSPQTSAITSGTSNCVDESPSQHAALFITINQETLKKDIARGSGESIVGLSKILDCSNADMLGNTLQKNYQNIFPSADISADQVTRSIGASIQSDAELAQACGSYI